MTTDRYTDLLSGYLDDELSAHERTEVEAHLATCADCRAVLADLERVVTAARGLEPGEPPRHLWAGIAGRIAAERERSFPFERRPAGRRFSLTVPQLAAAAVVLMLLSGGSVWMLADGAAAPPATTASTGPAAGVTALPVDARTGADTTAAAIAALERSLEASATQLDPETIAVMQRNLLIIDEALAEARAALASDPANPYLSRHYETTMQKKLGLLRQAGSIGRGAT